MVRDEIPSRDQGDFQGVETAQFTPHTAQVALRPKEINKILTMLNGEVFDTELMMPMCQNVARSTC